MPLIGAPSGISAAFRTTAVYEAPAIAERTEVDMPLIGAGPSATG